MIRTRFWRRIELDSLFLVMSYDNKYAKIESAIKNFFDGIYTVHMAKDSMQDILGCICEKINEADFGIVVLAGLKKTGTKKGGKKKYHVKMNIPFEYGMFRVSDKPVMLICEENPNFNINDEFSDIKNENYGEKFRLGSRQKNIEKRIAQIFMKFIPELARKTAKRVTDELAEKHENIRHRALENLNRQLTRLYKDQIMQDFREKVN